MENKINVAELLKDCPKGMELDCTMMDNVVFEKLDFSSSHHPIIIRRINSNTTIHLTKYGQYSAGEDYKCIIFPKGKTTWERFQKPYIPCKFNDGDIVATQSGQWIGITKGGESRNFVPVYCILKPLNVFEMYDYNNRWMFDRLATEEEKEKLFKVIKDNGYKWNSETKTLEKLVEPKFKVGDRIKSKVDEGYTIFKIQEIQDNDYIISGAFTWALPIKNQEDFELALGKFNFTTLKPFDKVLIRNTETTYWRLRIRMIKKIINNYDLGRRSNIHIINTPCSVLTPMLITLLISFSFLLLPVLFFLYIFAV